VTNNILASNNLTVTGNATISGNVHAGGEIELYSNLNIQQVSNTATIKATSNVVTEFSRSKKLIKYPRVYLTSDNDSGYIVTSSEEISGGNSAAWQNWKPFGGFFPANNHAWLTGSDSYPSVAGAARTSGTTEGFTLPQNLGTDSGGSATANGSWLKLQLPHRITLQYIRMNGNGAVAPDDFDVLGSNDDTNWNVLGSFTTPNPSLVTRMDQFGINATTSYLYYAVIIKSHRGSNHPYSGIYNLEYFGTPEYDPEAHGTDVTVKSYPNVPNTDWLEVYYDAKNYTSGVVQDETTNNIDATIGAATTFDSVNKAWSFSGTSNRDGTEFVSGYLPSDFEGNQIHSVNMWLKFDYWHEGAFCIIGKENRGNNDSHKAIHFQFQETDTARPRILYDFWSNQKSFHLPDDVEPGKWLHMTATYSGDAANRKMFVNGQELTTFITNSAYATSLALDTTNDLVVRLGTRFPVNSSYIFHGDIANFRLFNRALTTDEIYQLYAYQKEYFGHGDLSMTLKAGRLGIGTSEPRAMLDVRGGIYAPGTVVQVITKYNGSQLVYTSSGGNPVEMGWATQTIQPKFSNSKMIFQTWMTGEGNYNSVMWVEANGMDIPTGISPAYGSQRGIIPTPFDGNTDSTPNSWTFMAEHTISSSAPITYRIYYDHNGTGTIRLNRAYSAVDEQGICYTMITEVAQ
jgi:hypothetical protein